MTTVKFVSDNKAHKEFAFAVRANVNNYFKEKEISIKGNITLIMQTVAMLSMYIIPFILLLAIPVSAWLALPFVILMGIGAAGIGMCVMHDAVHRSYSKRNWANKLMGSTMYLLGGNILMWKLQHNIQHHAYTNVEGHDEDIAIKGPIRLSQFAPLKKIHRFQYIHAFFFYGLLTISGLVKDFEQLYRYNKEGLTKKHKINPTHEYMRLVLVKLIYLFVLIGLPILFTHFAWWQVLLGFFIIHWVQGFILSTVFQMAHVVEGAEQIMPDKDGIIACEWAVHELRTTSNFAKNNLFLNWYVGGLNFQIEHHLFPNISHVHYRKLSTIVQETAHEFGIGYNLKPSFRNALASHVRRLRELGQKKYQVTV